MLSTTERKLLLKGIYNEEKMQCQRLISNFQRRMYKSYAQGSGYHLRKDKDVAAKDKISTGANGIGQLTKADVEKFQGYYSSALVQ